MSKPLVYCDFNATTPLRPIAKEAMLEALDQFGNPNSLHRLGRAARGRVERAREKIAQAIHAQPEDITFTSGGSEANNTIMRHYKHISAKIFVSTIEHACVLKAVPEAERLPVTSSGIVDMDALKKRLEHTRASFQGPVALAVMYANNETGVIQPIQEIAALARFYDVRVHCDAVQMLGKVNLNLDQLGVDSLSFSAHKIGGPQGVGAYVARPQLKVEPLLYGGGQERGNRSGTENVAGIAGFGAAVEGCFEDDWTEVKRLRDLFESQMQARIPGFYVHGQTVERLPNTSYFSMPGFVNTIQQISFDLEHVCVGIGAACSSGKNQPSHVLKAMGCSDDLAFHSIRVSFGWTTTEAEIRYLVDVCERIYLRSQKERVVS